MKIEFLAFNTIEDARKYAVSNYPGTASDLDIDKAVGLFQPVYSSQDPNLIGVIITGGDWIKDFIVNHECAHAVFHWFERSRKDLNEELYCTLLGKLSAGILRFILENDPDAELFPNLANPGSPP